MGGKLSPELKAKFRPRIRHIHLPDLAPLYAPRYLPAQLRDFLHSQIVGQRYIAEAGNGNEPHDAGGDPVKAMRSWLRQASPPPTVLSFTRRPTYILPKHFMDGREVWEVQYMSANLKAKQNVVFPKPPQWDPLPFRPPWEADKDEMDLRHKPLAHKWDPGVMTLPCAEPMYFGPGQISIWPVLDLLDDSQRGKIIRTKYEFERILEDTTIQVLKREYGLDAFSIPGKSGVWVDSLIPPSELSDVDFSQKKLLEQTIPKRNQNVRRIATVHADFVDNVTRHGVSIHVGQPGPDVEMFGDSRINPWAAIRQDKITTSIASELAMKGSVPYRTDPEQQELEHRSDKKSLYLQTAFDEASPYIHKPLRAMPYSLVSLRPGLRQPTPMGLDNRDLSTAWTHEFARQLGLLGGVVDHFSKINFPTEASSLPTKESGIGFMARPVMGEDRLTSPYEQVEVPAIQLKEGGSVTQDILKDTRRLEIKDERIPPLVGPETWAISWPLYYQNLTKLLAESIRGLPRDTRLTQLLRNQTVQASNDRRWQAIQKAGVLRDAWRAYQNPRGRKPQSLPEAFVADIEKTTHDMRVILDHLEAGRVNTPRRKLLAKTEHIQKLVEVQNTQAGNVSSNPDEKSSGDTVTPLPLQGADEILRVTESILQQTKAWTQNLDSQTRPNKSVHSKRAFPRFTLTRAQRRAAMLKRMDAVKAAKLGPPSPKPWHQPLPSRRQVAESIATQKLDSYWRHVKWFADATL